MATSASSLSSLRSSLLALPRQSATLLLLSACVGEAATLGALWQDQAAVVAGGFHLIATLCLGLGVWLWLHLLPARDARAAAVASVGIAAAVPGLGLLGLLVVALPRWSASGQAPQHKLIERPMPRFSEEALNARAIALPTLDALSPAADVNARVAAVKALRNMEATRAIPLLRRALGDPSEDVRLLAHAILDRRERNIRAQLEASLAQLDAATDGEAQGSAGDKKDAGQGLDARANSSRRRAHVALASHYWELAYAGFVSGESARLVLEKAAQHAQAAAAYPGERVAVLTAIRAYLKLGQLERAGETLAWARNAGLPDSSLASLAAELAFLQRRFSQIDPALSALSPLSSRQPYVAQVLRFWGERGAS